MDALTVFWFVLIIILLIAEIATSVILVTIWFILPAVIALLLSCLNQPFWIQFSTFIILSIICLILTKPLAKKLATKKEKTNIDSYIGKEFLLIESITETSPGLIKIKDINWMAKTKNDTTIEKDSTVKVIEISGNTLIVEQKGEHLCHL